MNNYSNMSGLDLFTDPFLRQPQVYNQPPVRSSSTAAPQPKMADAKLTQQKPVAAQAQQPNTVAKPTTPPKAPAPQEKTKAPELAQEQKTVATTPADTQSEPPKKALELDMSTGTGTNSKVADENDQEKRKAHEAAEAKRKAEWEAKQAAKKQAEEEALQKINSMTQKHGEML